MSLKNKQDKRLIFGYDMPGARFASAVKKTLYLS